MSRRRSSGLPQIGAIFWAICLGIVVSGCEQLTHQGGLGQKPPQKPPQSAIHVIHAVPDTAALDFYLDGTKLAAGVAYRKSSGTLEAPPGAHKLEIRPAGTAAATPSLATASIYLQESQRLLITAVGRRNDSLGPTQLDFVAEPFGIVNDKELRVRFLHASPGAARLDVTYEKRALWSNATFGHFSPTWAMTANITALDLKLKVSMQSATTGTMTALAEATLKGSFAMGSVHTLIAFGELTPTSDETFFGLSLLDEQKGTLIDLPLTLADTGPKSALYVFHAASDAQAVDIYAENGARLVGALAYDNASPLLELMPGTYKLELRSAGTPTVLNRVTLKLVPDSRWALFLAGLRSAADPRRMLALYSAPMEQKGSGKSWRIIHAVPDAGPFALRTDDGTTLFSHLGYPYAAPYRQDPLPSGALQLRLVGDEEQGWEIAIPQTIADSVRDEVTTVYLTGTSTNPAQPLLAVALVESSAAAMRAPTLMPLSTTK